MKILLFASLSLALVACKGDKPAAGGGNDGNDGVYEVTGVVQALPGDHDAMIHIAHDPIPEFVGRDGKKNGMPAMTMPFKLAPGVNVGGLTNGDRVRFTFEVRWADEHAITLTKIAKSE